MPKPNQEKNNNTKMFCKSFFFNPPAKIPFFQRRHYLNQNHEWKNSHQLQKKSQQLKKSFITHFKTTPLKSEKLQSTGLHGSQTNGLARFNSNNLLEYSSLIKLTSITAVFNFS